MSDQPFGARQRPPLAPRVEQEAVVGCNTLPEGRQTFFGRSDFPREVRTESPLPAEVRAALGLPAEAGSAESLPAAGEIGTACFELHLGLETSAFVSKAKAAQVPGPPPQVVITFQVTVDLTTYRTQSYRAISALRAPK